MNTTLEKTVNTAETRTHRLRRLRDALGPVEFGSLMIDLTAAAGRPEMVDKACDKIAIPVAGISGRWFRRFSREIGGAPPGRSGAHPAISVSAAPNRKAIDDAILTQRYGEGGLRAIFIELNVKETTGLGWPRFRHYAQSLRENCTKAWAANIASPFAVSAQTHANETAALALADALASAEDLHPVELAALSRAAADNTATLAKATKILNQIDEVHAAHPDADRAGHQNDPASQENLRLAVRKLYGMRLTPEDDKQQNGETP